MSKRMMEIRIQVNLNSLSKINLFIAPMPLSLPPVSVEITKGNQRLCFNLSLVEAGEQQQFDFRVEEFYIAPTTKDGNEEVADQVYASSGRYIDPVS